jgi:NAD(P)-dependent dehydrogenase (short-subunit alcohol dehydrogenase family)/acyl carrier protein
MKTTVDRTELTGGVQRIFAEVTRYPLEILDLQSSLEEDLGIDSVKLGEVFAVLRDKYELPPELEIPPEKLRTIGSIADALAGHLGNGGNGHGRPAPQPAAAPDPPKRPARHGNGSLEPAAFTAGVREVFAEVTRYPLDILAPDASLEEDLGIDSVKLGEVFAVLRDKYELPQTIGIEPAELRTLGGVAEALRRYLLTVEIEIEPAPVPATIESVPPPSAAAAGATPAVKPFTGKIALVTGSGRGLGKDIASHLAELGATVVVNSFHSRQQGIAAAEEIAAAGGESVHLWGSVANPDHLEKIFGEIEERWGALDFFVSNASNGMLARLEEITPEHWEKAFRTNVVGLHQSALYAARLMRRRGGGKIVTLSSPAAHGYVDYFGCMGAVKAAVESLTRSLAIELARDNIQVNCVSPGPVYGELLDKWPESERLVAQWEANTAYGRLCEARDVSHFVAYLLSEPVRMFTGSVLIMDGGISSQGW